MGNILNKSTDSFKYIDGVNWSSMGSFYSIDSTSQFKKRINGILLNRKDVINGRVVYVNLVKYSCRIAENESNTFNFDLYNTLYNKNSQTGGVNQTTNAQIINIRLLGIRNFLPFIMVNNTSRTTDSFLYKFDNFNLPISIPTTFSWPIDFPSTYPGANAANRYDYARLCTIDMPEICAKQFYDNNSIISDVNGNFIWNYNVSRSVIPNNNINSLLVPLTGLYEPKNLYISPTTLNNFDYMGRFMKDSNGRINTDIVTNNKVVFANPNGKYFPYINFISTSVGITVPFLASDIYNMIDTAIQQGTSNWDDFIKKLYLMILRCIIINNFILQSGSFRLLTTNDKTLNIGEPMCACLNSPLGYNLNIAPISGNKMNSSNYNKPTPLLQSDNTPFALADYLLILNNPFDYRIKLAQNILNYYYYDINGNYIPPNKLSSNSFVYNYYGNQVSSNTISTQNLLNKSTGYSAYKDISSTPIKMSYATNVGDSTQINYNYNYANIYSINMSLSISGKPLYGDAPPSGPGTSVPKYSGGYVFTDDTNCSNFFENNDLKAQLPYYVQSSNPPNSTIICTNNINVFDNSSQTINIQGIVQNNICGNAGNVSVAFNTYTSGNMQSEYSCFNSNTSAASNAKTILVSGFNFNVNNNTYLSYSLYSGINGTYTTPLNQGNPILDQIIKTVGSNATLYIKNSPGETYNFGNNYYIVFTPTDPSSSSSSEYTIMIYQVINGVSILILSSQKIDYSPTPSATGASNDFCMKMDFLSCELLFKKMGRSIYDYTLQNSTGGSFINNSFEFLLQNFNASFLIPATTSMINNIYTTFYKNNTFFQNSTYIQGILQTTTPIIDGVSYFTSYLTKYNSNSGGYIPNYQWKYELDASKLVNSNSTTQSADSLYNNGLLVYGLNMPALNQSSVSTTQFLLTDRTNSTLTQNKPIYYILSETYNSLKPYFGAGPFNSTETINLAPYMYITDYSNSNNPDILDQYKIDTTIEDIISILKINNDIEVPLKIIYSAALYRYILFYDTSILGISGITNEQLSRNDLSSTPESDGLLSTYTKISNLDLINQINTLYFNTKGTTVQYEVNTTVANYNWQVISQSTFNKRLGKIYTNNVNVLLFTITEPNGNTWNSHLINNNYIYTLDPNSTTFNLETDETYKVVIKLENYFWFIYIDGDKCFQSNSTIYNFDFKTNYIDKSNDSSYWINLNDNPLKFTFNDITINTLEFDLDPNYFISYIGNPKTVDPNNLDQNKMNDIKLALDTFIEEYCGINYIKIDSNIFSQKSISNTFNVFYFIKFYINGSIDNSKRIYGNFLNELLKSTDAKIQKLITLNSTNTQLKSVILNILNVNNYYNEYDFINNGMVAAYDNTTNVVIESYNIYDTINSGYFFYEFPELDVVNNITIDSFTLNTSNTFDMNTFKDNIYKTFVNNPVFNINGPIVQINTTIDASKKSTYTIYYSFITILQRPLVSDDNIGVLGQNITLYNFTTTNSTTVVAVSTDNYTAVNSFIEDLVTNCALSDYIISIKSTSAATGYYTFFSDNYEYNISALMINSTSLIVINKYEELINFYTSKQTLYNNFIAQLSIGGTAMDDINAIINQTLLTINNLITTSINKIAEICLYTDSTDSFISYLYNNEISSFFSNNDSLFYYNLFCNLLPYLNYICNNMIIYKINVEINSEKIGNILSGAIIAKNPSIPKTLTDPVAACTTFDSCLSSMIAVNNSLLPPTNNNNNNNTPTKKSSNKTLYIVITVIILVLLAGIFLFFYL